MEMEKEGKEEEEQEEEGGVFMFFPGESAPFVDYDPDCDTTEFVVKQISQEHSVKGYLTRRNRTRRVGTKTLPAGDYDFHITERIARQPAAVLRLSTETLEIPMVRLHLEDDDDGNDANYDPKSSGGGGGGGGGDPKKSGFLAAIGRQFRSAFSGAAGSKTGTEAKKKHKAIDEREELVPRLFSLVIMKLFSRSAISASRLSVNDGLAHIALPFGPHTFWPERKLITENLVDVKGEDDVNVSFSTFRQISLPFSFRGGSNPEESYCQFIWDKLMDMIETDLKDRLPQSSKKNVEKVSGRQITAAGLELFCATNSSAPEPVLTFTTLSFTLGLIASESKSVNASLYTSMCQAIQMD
eukprot:gene3025-3297_t